MKAKLLFICREGFAYVAWQRIEVWLVSHHIVIKDSDKADWFEFGRKEKNRFNVSHTIADLMNGKGEYGARESPPVLIKADGCIFVESGESFTLIDFADAIATELGFEYITQDGDGV